MSSTMTQAQYADRIGTSRQYVNKLVQQGKITLDADGKIDPLAADAALQKIADPARSLADDDPPLVGDPPQTEAASDGGLSFSEARTQRERHAAELTRLQLEERRGNLLPKQEVLDSVVAAGRRIRQHLDVAPSWAEELTAAAVTGGEPAVRAFLREKVRELETTIADSLARLGAEDDDHDDGI